MPTRNSNSFTTSPCGNTGCRAASHSWSKAVSKASYVVLIAVFFYLWPQLIVSLLALERVLRDRRVRLLTVQSALVFASFLLVRARFNPHYTGPVVGGVFALVTQGMRHLRRWQSWGRPVGIGITRVVVLFAALLAPFNLDDKSRFAAPDSIQFRAQFINELDALPGQHLVIVHYSPQHFVFREWVYNGADIDGSKIVWAREIPGVSLQPLFDYFHGRQVWLAEPDASPPRLSRYASGALPQG